MNTDAKEIQSKLSESLEMLHHARITVACNLWSAIQSRDCTFGTTSDPAWGLLDQRLTQLGYPGTGTPSGEFLVGCC